MTQPLPDADLWQVLSCERRRLALEYLYDAAAPTTLTALADSVAAVETGTMPAPRARRESVSTSLRQTHLPTLERHGLVRRERDVYRTTAAAKPVVRHLRGAGPLGVSWLELYRGVGIAGLCGVVGSLAELPMLGGVDPLVPAVIALGAYAGSSAYHSWTLRPRLASAWTPDASEERWQPVES
ncbi:MULTISPECIES: DUF7344 domain-containing protein [Halolamina]|uniref:DUF7344 domain-containing protein n=1 Tax=Halolamina pelagica TaxID=699431 RepID=A0A1I5VXN7_9EURY|nr:MULTISPECIES: hypothetical protein [Halolamina]NHX37539.1 hypothetical protein [Halolamina sp. R1-12]SFQ12262.1 hypothetical protein SAMN05216277_12122 [Halolamina pelagica]